MSARRALQTILLISTIGVGFSGFLTFREFTAGPGEVTASCTALGEPGTILGYPPCVYGLVMYLLVFVISALGLRGSGEAPASGSA